MNYYLIQGIGFVGTLLFFVSFQCRSNRSLFRVQFLSYLFYTAHLLLLGAVTGAVSYIINTRAILSGVHYEDGVAIRRCAIQNGVTIFTSLDTVNILLDVLEETTLTISTIDA